MVTLVETLEIAACLMLIMLVLMQPGRGGMGPAFGGRATQQVFGSAATSKILMRATFILAAVVLVVTVLLAWLSSR